MRMLQIGCAAAILMIPGFKLAGVSGSQQISGIEQQDPRENRSGMTARVISVDGTDRTVTVEGAGCTQSMCSRVFLRGRAEDGAILQPLLYSIASIKNTTANDAVFVMRNGSELRLKLLSDFRVLYLTNRSGVREKLDLSKIRSLEFLADGK